MDIVPELEKRLQNSVYAEESFSFYFNNYRQLIRFSADCGKITLTEEPWKGTWECTLNPQGTVKLFFGHNTRAEIYSFLPDCIIKPKYQEIIDILFPRTHGQFYMNY